MRRWLAAAAALALPAVLGGPGAAASHAADCSVYPGDPAAKSALAVWMADGAVRRGVPPELPVMGALEASGLANRSYGDSDAVGFFQMRVGIWNQGEYAGFPNNPPLQLKWFLDQALTVRTRRVAAGDSGYGGDESRYGEWVADVIRPAERYRGRYQLRLGEARALIGAGCPSSTPGTGSPGTAPPAPVTLDTRPPVLRLRLARLGPGGRGILVGAACDEACVVRATARITIRGTARVYRLQSRARTLAPSATARLTLRFGLALRRALKRSSMRGKRVTAALSVRAVDSAGNASTRRTRLALRRRR